MAGWKLRKDKSPAETPDTEAEAAPPPEHSASNGSAPGEPEFESGSDTHFTDLDFDDDKTSDPLKHDDVRHDDGPLTLVDYTAPAPPDATPDSWFLGASAMEAAEIEAAEAPALGAAVYEMPPAAEPDFAPETDPEPDFSAPLSFAPIAAAPLVAEPPAPEFGAATPTVAPFVLDTPLPDALPDAPPQLVVHLGRLSAAFPLVKDVTTIGRPDSSLHYYPDIEIEMDDAVSRRHAEVVKRPGGYCLVDTGSTNGTLLNGERLPSHEERPLMHGDRIKVGDRTEITFE